MNDKLHPRFCGINRLWRNRWWYFDYCPGPIYRIWWLGWFQIVRHLGSPLWRGWWIGGMGD